MKLELLQSPSRGRAAVSTGGIIWRLAVDCIDPSIVEAGPDETDVEFSVITEFGEWRYIEDRLNDNDLRVMCGTYYIPTSM